MDYPRINVVCVLRQGGKVGYNATWVEKLKNSIERNLSIPHKFISLSDCDVPCERIPLETHGEGYWAKIQLFKPNLFNGPVLYFDLDTVICKNIDELVLNLLNQRNFIMWRDDDYNISSSALMYWSGDYSLIYNEYIKSPKYFENKFATYNQGKDRLVGDQALISTLVNHDFINNFCPKEWIHVVRKNDNALDLSQTRILIFRKAHTKPSTMPEHTLVKQHWK